MVTLMLRLWLVHKPKIWIIFYEDVHLKNICSIKDKEFRVYNSSFWTNVIITSNTCFRVNLYTTVQFGLMVGCSFTS